MIRTCFDTISQTLHQRGLCIIIIRHPQKEGAQPWAARFDFYFWLVILLATDVFGGLCCSFFVFFCSSCEKYIALPSKFS